MKDDSMLVSATVIFRQGKEEKTPKWFIVRTADNDGWEIPRSIVRRGESSVRAGLRMTSEQGGMRTRMLEEVGRSSGAAKVNGKPTTQRTIYYLLHCKDGGEVIGFTEHEWVEHKVALKRLTNKKDISMMADAKTLLAEVIKDGTRMREDEPEEELVVADEIVKV